MYKAPVEEIAFTLKHVAGLAPALEGGHLGDLTDDLVDAILSEAGRFATEEVAPLAEIGDTQGARLADGKVSMPDGWPALYKAWAEGGWNSLTASPEFGGQGLPHMLHVAALEMWNSGSMAFAIGPTLTIGAIEALTAHGSDHLKNTYLPKMVSGEWMGSMNLTEPHAGSDLGVMKTRAERRDDGTYRLFGQKIFITYGEHDFTDNIVHLVLARLPDAPAGTRGISLFLVPKFLVNADGSLGARNDAHCHSIEHKLGIHGSPTCTMIYGDGRFGDEAGAIGWLIGEENRGLACMFTMMNNARLAVGMQGVAICEAATQKAIEYAKERTQGKAPGWQGSGMSPIIEHPDIARTLLTMKALTQGSRAISFSCAHAIDMAHASEDGPQRSHWQERAALLTPIAKSFSTDAGVDVASMGIQVHGGMGFIEETGAARYLRDARIAPIYEGTNGIQAMDLVGRKLSMDGGDAAKALIADMKATLVDLGKLYSGKPVERFATAIEAVEDATLWLLDQKADPNAAADVLAAADAYLKLLGDVAGGWMLAKGALAAKAKLDANDGDPVWLQGKLDLYEVYAANVLGHASSRLAAVGQGGDLLRRMTVDALAG